MISRKKKALVTGATGKIGWAVCTELAAAGYTVGMHYFRSSQRADELAAQVRQLDSSPVLIKANLAVQRECDALVDVARKELGRIDAFIHCASVFPKMPLGEITPDAWDEIMAVNLRASFFLSVTIGLMMKNEVRDGRIVHFSDVAAMRPYGEYLPYCMAKAAIESMVRGLAIRLAPEVKICAIAPYMVRSDTQQTDEDAENIERIPLGRATHPSEIARMVRMLVGDDSTCTGQVMTIDGGRSIVW